jgi:Tfp pilus assembly protein PilV
MTTGSTLFEVLVALLLTTVGLLAFINAETIALRLHHQTHVRHQANLQEQNLFEQRLVKNEK